LWFEDKKITSDLPITIYDLVHASSAKEYWRQKDNLTSEAIESVNWESIDKAMKETKRSRIAFVSKHTCGMRGVGKFMKCWKLRKTSDYPRCGEHEDAQHVWKCQGPGVQDIWEKSLEKLDNWFNIMQTDPDIQHCILTYLRSWKDGSQPETTYYVVTEELLKHQVEIGWRQIFEGWLSREWTNAQQAYYHVTKSRQTGKCWTIALIKKLWEIAWDLWEHRNRSLPPCS
jgi:hypothetical protein